MSVFSYLAKGMLLRRGGKKLRACRLAILVVYFSNNNKFEVLRCWIIVIWIMSEMEQNISSSNLCCFSQTVRVFNTRNFRQSVKM